MKDDTIETYPSLILENKHSSGFLFYNYTVHGLTDLLFFFINKNFQNTRVHIHTG